MTSSATPLWRWLAAAALLGCLALPAQAQRNVTLRLNTATLPDTTGTAQGDIQLRGCLADCSGDQSELPGGEIIAWNDNTTLRPPNQGGDYWTINFQIPDNQTLFFKFFSPQAENVSQIGGWEDGENHTIESGTGDVDLVLHYFEKGEDRDYDWRPFEAGGDSVAVWFRVYMNTVRAAEKGYDANDPALQVGMRGNFGTLGAVGANGEVLVDWGEIAPIEREGTDASKPGYHLFSGVVKYPSDAVGEQASYKFYFMGTETSGDGGYEDGNDRSFTVPAQDTTLHWVYYSNSPPLEGELVTSQIVFTVDSEPLSDVGILNIARGDDLQVRGGFNGWDCPAENQDDCGLFQEPGTLNFVNIIPVQSVPGSEILYKYFVVLANVDQTDPATRDLGYEEPLDYGGGNRSFNFQGGAQQDIGVQFFNSIRAGNVIPESRGSVAVTFRVDMAPAMSYPGEDAFDPATDQVFVALEDQIWRLTQGYEPGSPSIDPAFTLSHVGDNIYEGTYTVDAPTYNGIGYAYAWGANADETRREGAGGFDPGRRRYRYIQPDGSGNFPASFTFGLDRIVGPSELNRWECNPTDPEYNSRVSSGFCMPVGFDETTVAIEDLGGATPQALALGAAYPNPFRGQTAMEYTLPQAGPVRVVVYDVLGRQVAVLVDEVLPASTYRVSFDANGLASGVYIARLEAGGAAATQRLTVLN